MATVGEPLSRSPFLNSTSRYTFGLPKSLPVSSATASPRAHPDAMEVSQTSDSSMAPPAARTSPGLDRGAEQPSAAERVEQQPQPSQSQPEVQAATNGSSNAPVGAAAAAQQPKVVQTAFIHKLYNMLEDQSIQHLISWSSNNESFVMSPSSEFSRVLAQYFKHTNISSFVRQLNMYGFHKVSDVFHTGAPDSPLWEFKHGAGNFKRGDLVGLREIKRRASRHALIHRDSFSNPPKMSIAPPTGVPQMEPLPPSHEPGESRFQMLEWRTNELHHRLSRTEEAYSHIVSKYQVLLENLTKCHHWNQELATHLLTLVPDPDNSVHRELYALRQTISRQFEQLRALEESTDAFSVNKPPAVHHGYPPMDTSSFGLSPRQRAFDESRRPSLQALGKPSSFKVPVPTHLQVSPRRYGSIGTSNGMPSPSYRPSHLPPPPVQPPPHPHPLATDTSPTTNLARRHTSADIRVHGWQGTAGPPNNHGSSPYASGQSSSAWPSSPRGPTNPGDQQLRDALAQYELPRPVGIAPHSANPAAGNDAHSRHSSPPPAPDATASAGGSGGPASITVNSPFGGGFATTTNESGWQLPGPRYPFRGLETPGSQTRRSSMASNVHALLNPADTVEREGEEDGPDERKRKRIQ